MPGSCKHYTPHDLAHRPLEHILEDMTCVEIAAALGCNKDTAALIKRDPSAFIDGPLEVDDITDWRLRQWLEQQR